MRIYHRYLVLNLLAPLLVVTLTLTVMAWLIRSMRFIDLIINNGLPFSDFVYLSSLLAPFFVLIILPIALFIAITYTYNKLIADSELIVLKAAGLSSFSLTKPVLTLAALVMFLSLLISLYIVPNAYREFKDIQNFFRNTSNLTLLQEGIFNTPMKGITIYIESQTKDGMLEGILVHDRNRGKPMTLFAQEGRLVQNEEGLFLDVLNGRQEIDHENGKFDVLYFDSYFMDLTQYSKKVTDRPKEPEERSLSELFFPEEEISGSKRIELVVEGHHRLVWPALSFSIAMMTLACILSGQFNRRGQWQRILAATILVVFNIAFDLGAKNLANHYIHCVVLMYLNVIIPIAISIHILRKGTIEFTWPWLRSSQSLKGAL